MNDELIFKRLEWATVGVRAGKFCRLRHASETRAPSFLVCLRLLVAAIRHSLAFIPFLPLGLLLDMATLTSLETMFVHYFTLTFHVF